jgi:putative transcriptional regulator
MKDEVFAKLVTSLRQAGAIMRGEAPASRIFAVDRADVRRVRSRYRLSQSGFAALLGISVKTLRNWEQGRRTPEGPARVLLQVAARHPDALLDIVRPSPPRARRKSKKR